MLLNFDINKAIAATAYLIERKGGSDDMFCVIKKLYLADRTALIRWGNSITGDRLASMKQGPIVSGIYDLLKGKGKQDDQILWNDVIVLKPPYTIMTRKAANEGVLSVREKEVLDEAQQTIDSIRGSISKWLHKNCPEWTNPGKSSMTIDPSMILRHADKSEEDIRRIEEANEELRLMNYLLSV